jgi:hypothetical protein
LPIGYIFYTEQCKEDCIPHSSRSYNRTQVLQDHRKKTDALCIRNCHPLGVLAVGG